jgi:hypothetical protein
MSVKAKPSRRATPIVRNKEVLYPILLECAKLTRDEFWVQFYQDLAIGKSTKGIFISHGVIQSSNNKRNGFAYSITDKAPEVIVPELHHLITSHTSICSRKDTVKRQAFIKELDSELKEYKTGKWTSIKRKNLRAMLLVNYAISLQKAHDLSWDATIAAYRTIVMAFETKTHSSKDVEYENGKILNIDDIEASEDGTYVVNARAEACESEIECPATSSNGPGLIRGLWEPYISAWLKVLK